MFVCVARSSRCVGSRHPILYEHPSDEVCLHSSFAVGAMSSPPAPNSSYHPRVRVQRVASESVAL